MIRMLVRVINAQEAAQAAAAGVDIVEFRVARADQREMAVMAAIRAAYSGQLRLRFASASAKPDILKTALATRADEAALPLRLALSSDETILALTEKGVRVVAQVELPTDAAATLDAIGGHDRTVMFEAASARLLDVTDVAHLDGLATACKDRRLAFGFAGGLEAPDVARVLLLEPDILGFDTAVRVGHDPAGRLDPDALQAIRALLPGERPAARTARHTVRDRLFVRKFVVPVSIGAYQAERGATQRVRFSVEVEVAREPVSPHDMRDVFSYDVIIETIRRLSARGHVTFVETLAEEVAAALLAQPAVLSTTVSVEKLDVIDGEVGIEIRRRRSS